MSHKLSLAAAIVLIVPLTMALNACQSTEQARTNATPPPTYRGPEFLRGTIGSLTSVQGYEPVLVSGYGLVVGLDGTGSADAPPQLRQWMLGEMAKRGFGSFESGYEDESPEEVLARDSTAIVLIEGFIPPGAPSGTRFDLVISTLPETQATSVQGGTLYTADLTVGGRNFTPTSVNALARGNGPVFSSPFADEGQATEDADVLEIDITNERNPAVGRILGGGTSSVNMPLQLVTTRPSYLLTRQIADRINGSFPPSPEDKEPIAVPQSDTVIKINVIEQWKDDPREMLEIITHLDMNPRQDYAKQRAERLVEVLENDEAGEYFDHVVYAFKGMGTPIVDDLRELYEHPNERVRLAALSAASYLRDTRSASPLMELVQGDDPEAAEQAAQLLGGLLEHRPDFSRVGDFLRRQLDHDLPAVRVAAYKALVTVEHPSVQRFGFERKLELAHARAQKPIVHLTQSGVPRIIVFGNRIELAKPLFFSAWGNSFMLRADSDDDQIAVFYQPASGAAIRTTVPNSLVHLIGAMAYEPEPDSETVGLSMGYSEIAYILHRLQDEGLYDAPLMLQETGLNERIIESRGTEDTQDIRPETGGDYREADEEDLTPAILVDPNQPDDAAPQRP
ncbi:MAG: flagellar basal body P-ring protein FlgI [Phycisphaeraceae bacterium]